MTYPSTTTFPSTLTLPGSGVVIPPDPPDPPVFPPAYTSGYAPAFVLPGVVVPTTAEYKYLFCDLLTNQVNLEVPLYGVSFGRQINKASDCTFSLNLDRIGFANSDSLGATVPGKTAFYIDRNGSLIFGGIIWSRTYQSQAKVLQFTGQSFESYFYNIVIEDTLIYKGVDQRNILCDLILKCQQKPSSDIGIKLDPNYPFANNIVRSTSFYDYDTWTFGKAIDYLVEYDTGLDYTIEVAYDEFGLPSAQVRVDNRLGATVDNTGIVLQYPGNIMNYYWPENASRGAASVVGTGSGDGVDKLRVKITNDNTLAFGYPNLQQIYSNQDVSVLETLTTQTASELDKDHLPVSVPTIEVDPSNEPQLGTWAIGDYALLDIEDPRFEEGLNTSVRIIGYTASPPSSDGSESCSLIVAGQDDV